MKAILISKIFYIAVIIILIVGVAALIYFLKKKDKNNETEEQESTYEALVQLVNEKSSNPKEDTRSSLKRGDVIVYFPENHSWSDTEKNSYLLIKLKLKKEDAEKLTQSKTKEVKNDLSSESERTEELEEEIQQEIILARKYRINLDKIGAKEIQINDLLKGQPLFDNVFDKKAIKKKR